MRRRTWYFRGLGLACLVLGLAVAVLGVLAGGGAFPYNANPFLSRKAANASDAEAGQYYAEISAPATLAAWKTAYFPVSGNNRANANYYNAGDLGFGREMHCYEEFAFTACYVANHGLGAGAPAEISVQDVVANTRILPTVAMVYTFAINGQPNDVKFYVYDTAGNRLNSVALDSEGAKFVPNLCLACHGGDYDDTTDKVTDANFLPWDIDSFIYSPTAGSTKTDQLEQFRVLNAMVRLTFPDSKITNLIDGWYGGANAVSNPGAVYDDSYILPAYDGNATNQQLYNEVVKPYCRGCHMAQGFDLEDPTQLGSAFSAVFTARDMPHAQLTNHRFWSSPAPAILARIFASNTYTVTTTDDTTPDGCTSAMDNGCTLREAVIAANSNSNHSIIVFDVNGTFGLTRAGLDDNASAGDLDITADLTLLGNSATQTIIDGGGLDRVFQMKNGVQVLIQNVTIQNGTAAVGAGLHVTDGGTQLTINYSVVRNNHGTTTGFTGVGLAAESGAGVEINQSAFTGNIGLGEGGAILNDGSIVAIYNSTLSSNQASDGGAVFTRIGGQTTLNHVTVAFNNATNTGGGLASASLGFLNLINSIVAGNTSPGATDCYKDAGSVEFNYGRNLLGQNFVNDGCLVSGTDLVLAGAIGTALRTPITTDPVHGVPGYMPLGPALDAIAVGPDCSTPSYDAFNVTRPRDANNNGVLGCDIGAVEMFTRIIYLPQLGK